MHLELIDWIIVAATLAICFIPALFFGKRASQSTSEFFVSGRSVPWWLAGLSMVATTFSSDTPNWVTQQVRQYGVAGNWQWWAFVLTGVSTVFFFARLWRRSGVMTDLEFYELRYSGKAASVVRGFRAIYLGFFFNCFIMGMVTLAACKIANILFGLPPWQTILVCGILNVIFAAHSGLWGVLVIDMVQFFIKMTAVIAAAYFSLKEVARRTGVGESAWAGLHKLVATLGSQQVNLRDGVPVMSAIDGHGQPVLNFLPNFSMWELALMVFLVPIAIGWWANWYPGAEPGGGSYIAQRMLASKSEKDALGGTLFFNFAHYVVRPWPWILTALCSIIVFPELKDIQAAFPAADPQLIGHDSAFPAMLKFLPVGFVGLMVGGLIAANSSTILTHLNWGSSYLVHDFYRRFINSTAGEKHYVNAGRLCTLGLYICAAFLSRSLNSAQDAFEVLISIGAGTGLLYLLRWFWWRINAWCEVVAMISSFLISAAFFVLKKTGHPLPFAPGILCSVAFTTVCWMVTAFVTAPTSRDRLIDFYRKVHPSGPGWRNIRIAAGVTEAEAAQHGDHMGMATAGWVSGCALIWSALFATGDFLYGRNVAGIVLVVISALSAGMLLYVISRLWPDDRKAGA
ncbi:MAG TPA: sodium:solute symporter family protein [Verrucomicrobiae bacterium]|jgi:Na+/proline symporter|nr:sodium:solute symporter family protein [Verrucomicrobiae bacterium]